MNISEHTKIFKAYIDRAMFTDLDLILTAVRRCMQEQLNGNAGSQEQADFALHSAVMGSLERMLTHDRQNISTIIHKIVDRETV